MNATPPLSPEITRKLEDLQAELDMAVVNGYTVAQLRTTFHCHCDPADWKAPIDTLVEGTLELAELVEAIVFFTATEPVCTIEKRHTGEDLLGRKVWYSYRVRSVGYRAGPAGP